MKTKIYDGLMKCPKRVGYRWSFNFHATRLLLLRCILNVFGPSMTAYARHYFGHFEDDQQYRAVQKHTRSPLILHAECRISILDEKV